MEKGPERMRDDLVRLWAASSYQSAGELAKAAAWAMDPALAARDARPAVGCRGVGHGSKKKKGSCGCHTRAPGRIELLPR